MGIQPIIMILILFNYQFMFQCLKLFMVNSEYHLIKQVILSCYFIHENTQEKRGKSNYPGFKEDNM